MRQSKQLFRSTAVRIAAMMAVVAASFAGVAQAAGTDRAQYAESASVVGQSRLQVETSLAVQRDGSNLDRSYSANTPSMLRFGVNKHVEVRVGTDGFSGHVDRSFITSGGRVTRGTGDLSLGLKVHAADQVGFKPAIGVIMNADYDTGSSEFRGNGVRPSVHVAAEWKLAHGMTLGFMPGLTYNKDDAGRRYTSTSFGVVLGKAWTSKFSSFVEYAAPRLADSKHGGNVAYFNVGAAYQVAPQSYLDVSVKSGTTHNTPDMGMAVGFTTKF